MTTTDEQGKRFARVTADVSPEVAQALKVHCAQNGIRLKQAVSQAITDFANRGRKQPTKKK